MHLVIETDIGRDPDDLLALCYLCQAGVNISAVVVSPGDQDQIAVVNLVKHLYGGDFPVGACESVINKTDRRSSNKFHQEILRHYKLPLTVKADDIGWKIIRDVTHLDPQFFVIGPAKNMRAYLMNCPPPHRCYLNHMLMQGGFCPYSVYRPSAQYVLNKFDGHDAVASFNPNGEPRFIPLALENMSQTSFVGKNVCHTIEYERRNKSRVFQGHLNAMFNKHLHKAKRLHDVVAALMLVHPDELGTWVSGVPDRQNGKYTTILSDDPWRKVLVDIDREKFWNLLETT